MQVRLAGIGDSASMLDVVHRAFRNRPVLDPPATAMEETVESVEQALAADGGLLVVDEPNAEGDGADRNTGELLGSLLFEHRGDWLGLRRVGVVPSAQGRGVAARLAASAMATARERGYRGLELEAREELPATVAFWKRLGYDEISREGPRLIFRQLVPDIRKLPEVADTQALAAELASELAAGDVVILSGGLGAGKTTFTQGLGRALHVRGDITSPTFVIARVHPALQGGPDLVHVDAYRLGEESELDDLDLDTDLANSVTVIEWGAGLAESLSESRIEIELSRADDDVRTATVKRRGPRWLK